MDGEEGRLIRHGGEVDYQHKKNCYRRFLRGIKCFYLKDTIRKNERKCILFRICFNKTLTAHLYSANRFKNSYLPALK